MNNLAHPMGFIRDVPCNGCTLCCHGDAIRLLPQDDASAYLTEPHDHYPGQLMLAHKANRDCVYLGESGCTIHDKKPLMCREMDCRNVARSLGYTAARKLGVIVVWQKGKSLLAQVHNKEGQ
jgi:hypothetical protein